MSDKIYILDTSALFTFIEDEEGADTVDNLLIAAEKGDITIYVSFISLTEVFYITKMEHGEQDAVERVKLIQSLAINIKDSDESLNILAGGFKANYRMSLADAFIAALCQYHQGILVHKDPALEQLTKSMQELRLPYKKKL